MAPASVLDRETVQEKLDVAAIDAHGDRARKMEGCTKPSQVDRIELVYNAELAEKCCLWMLLDVCTCKTHDKERSYMFIRESALEVNDATKSLCCGGPTDDVTVSYFDNDPFTAKCVCFSKQACCFCIPTHVNPKVELAHNGVICCCVKCDPCCGPKLSVGLTPFQYFPFPCCCCANHTTKCDQCLGCYGVCMPVPVLGNPKVFIPFKVQPKYRATFTKVLIDRIDASQKQNKAKSGMPPAPVAQEAMVRA